MLISLMRKRLLGLVNQSSKRFLISDMSIVQSANWIDAVAKVLATYDHPLNGHDREQLEQELRELKQSFLD